MTARMLAMRTPALIAAIGCAAMIVVRAADQGPAVPDSTPAGNTPTIRITAPLGRTGIVSKMRIVARVDNPASQTLSTLSFFVDGAIVGTAQPSAYASVDWTDENPFEQREIVVQAADASGRIIRDSVTLPPFELIDETEVRSVLLETGVYDKTGRFASELEPSVFRVSEDGVPQKIDLVARETLPTNLVLLVDNSQSMLMRMDFVRLAAERLARTLRVKDKVTIVPFNVHIGRVTGPTNDAPTITQAITAMRAGGGTAFLDALREATHLLDRVEGRRAVVLITDGYDENSTTPVADVVNAAQAAQVTVYVVGIGGVAGISLKGESTLQRVADETGGRVFFPPREPDLVSIADAVAADAHSRYLITYTPENQAKNGTWRRIAVDVPVGYRVRTRAGYFAPSPPPIRPALEFTITNAADEFVDIAPEDLEVVEDGVVQKIEAFQEAVDPVSIVMALDASGSMKKSADAVEAAALDFVAAVRPEDSLGLIMFADSPVFAHVLGTSRQPTLDAIAKYEPAGGTALYDALWDSLMHLKEVPGRHAVVVLTDGRDENDPGTAPGSAHTIEDVLKALKDVNAALFPIGLGTRVERSILERLAAESGGEAYFPLEASALGNPFHRVVENLRRRYVVTYTSTNAQHDGAWRNVEIRPRIGQLTVATRGGYFAPGR